MGTPDAVRAVALARGWRIKGDFVLGPEAWWANYYVPLEARIARLEAEARNDAARLVLAEARKEIACFREHGDRYGYLFVVLAA